MADETRNANVVLSADVQPYSQDINKAYQDTNKLIESVNKLATSLDGITKRVGKKIMIFAAADIATATAMVLVTAKYEKQLSTLNAQLTLSNKNLGVYKKGIDEIARVMPSTREELTRLATQIHELGVTSEREAIKMTRTFTQLAAATGEDVGALTSGLVELSRQMGTLNNGANGIANFADSLTMVASASGVSAGAVLNFAQSISPFARAAGLGQKELLGISAAFTRAGADGFAAANAFNTILADITRQIQTGSPEIAKYSNAVGVTMEAFKDMGPAEQLTAIFDAVNKAGPDAIKLLDRMGIDGIRAAKAIQAVSNEQGGLSKAIKTASEAYGGGATEKGATAAFDTFDAKATKLRNNMTQVASSIGEGVMPFAKALLDVMNQLLNVVNQIATPFLKLGGAMMAVMGPVTGAVGALVSLMGPLSSLMLGFMALRFTPMKAFFQGSAEGVQARQGTLNRVSDMGGRVAAWRLEQQRAAALGVAPDPTKRVPWYQMAGYNIGRLAGETRVGVGLSRLGPASLVGAGTFALRGIGALAEGSRIWAQDAALRGNAAFDRRSMFRALDAPLDRAGGALMAARTALTTPGPDGVWKTFRSELAASNTALKQATASTVGVTAAQTTQRLGLGAQIKTQLEAAGTLEAFRTALARASTQLAMYPLSLANFGRKAGGQIAGAAGNILGSLGGMIGVTGPAGIAVGATAATLGAGYLLKSKQSELASANVVGPDTQRNIAATNAGLGLATDALGDFTDIVGLGKEKFRDFVSVTDAMTSAIYNATTALGEYTDANVEKLSSVDQAVGYLQAQGPLNPDQAASLAADVNKRWGPLEGAAAIKQYLNVTGQGENPYASGMFSKLTSGAVQTQMDNQGFEGPFKVIGQLFTSDAMSKQIGAGWAAALQDLEKTSQTYNSDVSNQKLGTYINESLAAAFDEQEKTAGGIGYNFSVGKVQEQTIKNLEAIFGEGKFTVNSGVQGVKSGFGSTFSTGAEIVGSLFDTQNDSEMARNFRDWAKQNGMTAADFTGAGAKDLAARVSKGMSEEQFSDWEKGVRRTNLGEFSRENKIIESVTSGTKISDPLSVVNAVSLLSKEAQKGGAGIAEVTAEFQKLKQAVGDVNDPLYQLAQAAQDMATRQMSFSKGITGGRFAGLQATWDAATATQANFVNTTAGREEWMGAESSKQAVREQLIGDLKQYNNTVYEFNKQREYNEKDHADSLFQMEKDYNSQTLYAQEDFQLQRLYAVEDFNRSMKRAAEDGAKAMFNPYQREATKATVSIDMALSNLSEQKYLKKQGLNAVDQMRQAGVSDDAIAFFDLLNPANALQAQQFAYDVQADPSRVKEINKGTKGAVAVSSQYQQDPSNRDTARNVEDFERSMNRSDKAFDVSLERAAKAYEKQLWRIENSYDKSVDRSKKALQDYGREVMGTVETIIGDTSARLFEALGENTTEYFNNLNYYITNNGINEDGSTTPPGMTGASVPHGATSAAAAEANAGIDPMGGHTPGPSGAWKDNGEWWGMNSRGERFRLPDSWKPFSELSAAEQHEARIHKWVNAAKNAGFTAFANGGIATRSIYGNVGEAGPEAVIPLNAGGGQFLGKIYGDITMAMVKQMRTAGFNSPSAYGSGSGSTQINRNTNFTGPITVQAQDPNEMARKLESKKRLTNLRLGANASV